MEQRRHRCVPVPVPALVLHPDPRQPGRELTIHAPYLNSRSSELTEFWFRLADLATRQVRERSEVYANDVVRALLVDGLTAVTVEAFRLTDQQEHERIRDDQLLQHVDAFIQTHLKEPISIPEIAADAGFSVRGLQVVVQRRVAQTPIAHLRRKRLEAARIALMNPGPDSTVGEIGRRLGYSDLGRSSAHYRNEFDEIPSRTLERARPQR